MSKLDRWKAGEGGNDARAGLCSGRNCGVPDLRQVVAIRQAWEQCARLRNERPAGAFPSPQTDGIGACEYPEPPGDSRDVSDQVADRIQPAQRLAELAAIKPKTAAPST